MRTQSKVQIGKQGTESQAGRSHFFLNKIFDLHPDVTVTVLSTPESTGNI